MTERTQTGDRVIATRRIVLQDHTVVVIVEYASGELRIRTGRPYGLVSLRTDETGKRTVMTVRPNDEIAEVGDSSRARDPQFLLSETPSTTPGSEIGDKL